MHFRVNLDAVDAAFNDLYPGEFIPLSVSTVGANAPDVDSTFGGACFDNRGEEDSTNGGNGKSHVWPIGTAQSDDENDTILNNIINTSTTTSETKQVQEDGAGVVGDSFADDDGLPSSLSNERSTKLQSCKGGEESQAGAMYQAYCEAMGIGRGIPNAAKLRDMQKLVEAGMKPEEIADLVGYTNRRFSAEARRRGEPVKGKVTPAVLGDYHDEWRETVSRQQAQSALQAQQAAARAAQKADEMSPAWLAAKQAEVEERIRDLQEERATWVPVTR